MEKVTKKYLEKIEEDYSNGKMIFSEVKVLEEAYLSSTDEEKQIIEGQYEEYIKELDIKNYHNDVRGIRRNVQFFFWIFIISIISTIIFLLF